MSAVIIVSESLSRNTLQSSLPFLLSLTLMLPAKTSAPSLPSFSPVLTAPPSVAVLSETEPPFISAVPDSIYIAEPLDASLPLMVPPYMVIFPEPAYTAPPRPVPAVSLPSAEFPDSVIPFCSSTTPDSEYIAPPLPFCAALPFTAAFPSTVTRPFTA